MPIMNKFPMGSSDGSGINELISQYRVYTGNTVNAGDFVKFIQQTYNGTKTAKRDSDTRRTVVNGNGVTTTTGEITSTTPTVSYSYPEYAITTNLLDSNYPQGYRIDAIAHMNGTENEYVSVHVHEINELITSTTITIKGVSSGIPVNYTSVLDPDISGSFTADSSNTAILTGLKGSGDFIFKWTDGTRKEAVTLNIGEYANYIITIN